MPRSGSARTEVDDVDNSLWCRLTSRMLQRSRWMDASARSWVTNTVAFRRAQEFRELTSEASARLGGESVASPTNLAQTAVRAYLLVSWRRIRCITLTTLREFVSTMATRRSRHERR